jgi:N utilization substance protein A
MDTTGIVESFSEFKEAKNVDKATLMGIIEEVFRNMLAKKFGTDKNFDIIINPDNGSVEIFKNRIVVDDEFAEDSFEYDENRHISLSEARKIDDSFEIGEEVSEKFPLEKIGRRAVLALRQNLNQKILELQKTGVYKKYKDKVGEIVTAEVYQIWKKEILLVDEDGNELILPKSEQIPGETFKKGDTIKAVVTKVEMRGATPYILVSRTSPVFLEKLFENEVPEIYDGLITIKKVVREPGERAKVAVESYDERIDPVGACVGMKGGRIHGIVRELRNENIDVINYTTNDALFIQRALSPAKISRVVVHEDERKAEVYMHPEQISLAIGKNGYNIKLASKLTGYQIDVFRESDQLDEDDVELTEFADEIDPAIIEKLKAIGCDTARSVLELSTEEICRRTGLDKETANRVLEILKAEFEED